MADVPEFSHDFSGLTCIFYGEVRRSHTLPALPAFLPHRFQGSHAAFITGSPGFDALAYPDFFLGQFFVEQLTGPLLCLELLLPVAQESLVVSFPQRQVAPVQFGHSPGYILQKAPVMGDQYQGSGKAPQLLLEPVDGGYVEVVGRFVKQQNVRFADQRLSQRNPSPPTAGQLFHRRVSRQL